MRGSGQSELCVVVLEAIASAEGVEPGELEFTLHDHISPDAIDLLDSSAGGRWTLTFDVPGHEISVRSDRTVIVDGQTARDHS